MCNNSWISVCSDIAEFRPVSSKSILQPSPTALSHIHTQSIPDEAVMSTLLNHPQAPQRNGCPSLSLRICVCVAVYDLSRNYCC